jgi:hypothetical protein
LAAQASENAAGCPHRQRFDPPKTEIYYKEPGHPIRYGGGRKDALRGKATKKGEERVAEIMERMIEHPKTSAAGLLLGLTTVLGVLQQQGISLGQAGTGTIISLATALATALLGLLAKD